MKKIFGWIGSRMEMALPVKLGCWAISVGLWVGLGCGGGTGTGNPPSEISLVSRPFATASLLRGQSPFLNQNLFFLAEVGAQRNSIQRLEICVEKLEIKAADDSLVVSLDEDRAEVNIGLVELGDGTVETQWGQLNIPLQTEIKRIKMVVHKTPEVCGVEYSMRVNDQTVTRDLELKFSFSGTRALNAGEEIRLTLSQLVTQLVAAYGAGDMNDESISSYVDGSFEDEMD